MSAVDEALVRCRKAGASNALDELTAVERSRLTVTDPGRCQQSAAAVDPDEVPLMTKEAAR